MTIVNAAGRAMTDVTDDSQLCDVTDDQKPPGTPSCLTVGLPDPYPDLAERRGCVTGMQISAMLLCEKRTSRKNVKEEGEGKPGKVLFLCLA